MATRLDTSQNRPQGFENNNGVFIPDSFSDEAFQGEYDGSNNLIYKGFARPGAPTSASVWQIAKLTYDGNNNILMIQWPINNVGVASNDYEFVWDNRHLLTYIQEVVIPFKFNPFTDKLDLTGTSGGGGGSLNTLTGNTGGPVSPTGGNINVFGAGAISVSGNPGTSTFTISSSFPFFTWNVETLSFSAVNQNGYFCNGAAQLAITLPTISNVGDTIEIVAMNANGWKINLVSGQQIQYGNVATSVNGTLSSQQIGDTVLLVCNVVNAGWMAVNIVGTLLST